MIRLIAAIDKKRGLARDGEIPWNIPEDVKRFRQFTLTHGANVFMGRRTYEMLGQLTGRHYYVLSSKDLLLPSGVTLVNDLETFFTNFKEDIWVIGGEAVYNTTIKYADELYLTIIEADFDCDQFFPDYSNFELKESEGPFTSDQLTYSYQTYSRSRAKS